MEYLQKPALIGKAHAARDGKSNAIDKKQYRSRQDKQNPPSPALEDRL
jgi:hypothetical protein